MDKKEYISSSIEQTNDIAKRLANSLKGGYVICLYGDLGAGKTTFTQAFAKSLGIEKRLISPTFTMIRSYKVNDRMFYHIDLYRTETEADIKGLGLEELFAPDNIVVIEWAEKLGSLLPSKRVDIHFELLDDDKRKLIIQEIKD